jgi:hypothetical protein
MGRAADARCYRSSFPQHCLNLRPVLDTGTGSMGRTGGRQRGRAIPDNVRLEVWVRCGGRCAICNRYLLDGGMTGRTLRLGELAHIVGRHNSALSP